MSRVNKMNMVKIKMRVKVNHTNVTSTTKKVVVHALSVVGLILTTWTTGAGARTDVNEKIVQLRENAESSRINLKQYEDNLSTVNANLVETEKALQAIERQKQALAQQTSETQKGKMNVDGAKKQIEGFLAAEKKALTAEQKQIEELKKTLAQLEANQMKRLENIAAYDTKMLKVDAEFASWSERNQSIVELEQAIKEKEALARADQKRLTEKKAAYEEEITKWKKQVRISERTYENFAKLKD